MISQKIQNKVESGHRLGKASTTLFGILPYYSGDQCQVYVGERKKLQPCYKCLVIIPSSFKPLFECVPFRVSHRNIWKNTNVFFLKISISFHILPFENCVFFLFQFTRPYSDILDYSGNIRWYHYFLQTLWLVLIYNLFYHPCLYFPSLYSRTLGSLVFWNMKAPVI